MDTEQDALEYGAIDNTEVNRAFAERALELCGTQGKLIDLGTGPADIVILIAQRAPSLEITAIDLAEQMLVLARRNVARHGLERRIALACRDAKQSGYPSGSFDAVIANSLVHHMPEPLDVFVEIARLAKPSAGLFIKDLLRPSSAQELERLVAHYAAGQSAYQQQLFADSLHAALRVEEVEALCQRAGLTDVQVQQVSDRHWTLERPARRSGFPVETSGLRRTSSPSGDGDETDV